MRRNSNLSEPIAFINRKKRFLLKSEVCSGLEMPVGTWLQKNFENREKRKWRKVNEKRITGWRESTERLLILYRRYRKNVVLKNVYWCRWYNDSQQSRLLRILVASTNEKIFKTKFTDDVWDPRAGEFWEKPYIELQCKESYIEPQRMNVLHIYLHMHFISGQ